MPCSIAAIIVTYRREQELARLLRHLGNCDDRLAAIVVVDNAALETTRVVLAAAARAWRYLPLSDNSGCGMGWRKGAELATNEFRSITHYLFLDDDVAVSPNAFAELANTGTAFDGVVPLVTDGAGTVWGCPEPKDRELRKQIRQIHKPEDAVRLLGSGPVPICWSPGTCVLVSRAAMERIGFHRDDFVILGEDMEFSMRLSASGSLVLLPTAVVQHLPPKPDGPENEELHRWKFRCLLRNQSYIGLRLPHRYHLGRYLPGNFLRYFRTFGLSFRTILEAWECFWLGAVLGRPAGQAPVFRRPER